MAAVIQKKRMRIGELLVSHRLITENQLEQALKEQKQTGRKLGQVLIGLELIDEIDLLTRLSEQLEIEYIDLKHFPFNRDLVKKLPEVLARRFRAMILREDADSYLLGMADPTDIFCIDELSRLLKKPFVPALVRESSLSDILDIAYTGQADIALLAHELEDEIAGFYNRTIKPRRAPEERAAGENILREKHRELREKAVTLARLDKKTRRKKKLLETTRKLRPDFRRKAGENPKRARNEISKNGI